MKCTQCGQTIPDTSQHCAYCGAEIQYGVLDQLQAQIRKRRRLAFGALIASGLVFLVGVYLWKPRTGTQEISYITEVINATTMASQTEGQQVEIIQATKSQPTPNEDQVLNRIEVSTDDDPKLGPINAPIIIVEFGDYKCPYCRKFHEDTFQQLLDTYPDQILFVYRDFPVVGGFDAAQASECADEQDAFWDYHDLLFSGGLDLGEEGYRQYAEKLGLDADALMECLHEGRYASEVEDDARNAASLGVNAIPTFFINGIPLTGAQPLGSFTKIIDRELRH